MKNQEGMNDKIKVQVFENDKLVKQLEEDNVIIIGEFQRGEMCSKLGISEAIMLLTQLSLEYDHLIEIAKKEFHATDAAISEAIKFAKLELKQTKFEVK